MIEEKQGQNNLSMHKRAVGYIRCSTDMQADTSPEQQQRIITEWAALNNYEILRWYQDIGKSGTSFEKRKGFLSLKEDAENNRDFDYVLVLDETRWGRAGARESFFHKIFFEKLNVKIQLVRTVANTGNEVIDTMLEAFEGGLSREESKKKSERCLDGGINVSIKGWSAGGTAPYGYQRVAENKYTGERRILGPIMVNEGQPLVNEKGLPMYEQRKPKEEHVVWDLGDPKEVETVKKIFDWTVYSGLGVTKIAKMLNSLNIECPKRGRWRNIDSKWSASTVNDIIRNYSYTGARVYNRLKRHGIGKYAPRYKENNHSKWIIIENAHPAIVTKDLWSAANSTERRSRYHKHNRFSSDSPYLLSGLIRCSHCKFSFTGRSMSYGRPGNRRKEYVYIDSGYARKGNSVCSSLNINKKSIEGFILNTIKDRLLASNFQQRLQQALEKELKTILPDIESNHRNYRNKLQECEKKISSLLMIVEKGVKPDTIVSRIRLLEDEKDQLKQKIKESESQRIDKNEYLEVISESRDFIKNFVDRFEDLSLPEKKETMKKFVKEVIVDREKKVARCFIRSIPQFKQHPVFNLIEREEKSRKSLIQYPIIRKQKEEPVINKQLSSSLECVPPTRFELVFQA